MNIKEELRLEKKEALNRLRVIKELFTRGTKFYSADDNMRGCFVRGVLKIKWTDDEQSEEFKFNGDIVSSNGVGCVYDASTDKLATIIE